MACAQVPGAHWRHNFLLAEPECPHIGANNVASGGDPGKQWHQFKCDACGAEWRRIWDASVKDWSSKPKTPECDHESWEVTGEHHTPEGWVKSRRCADCTEDLDNVIEAEPHWDIQPVPRRPPYAVAYDLQDGTQYEVALPGDATVCALDGALIITHASSPVKGLTQVQPFMNTEQ